MPKGQKGNRSHKGSEFKSHLFRNEQDEITRILIGINPKDPAQQDIQSLELLCYYPIKMLDSVHSEKKASQSPFSPYTEMFMKPRQYRTTFAKIIDPSFNFNGADEHTYYGWHWRAIVSFINQFAPFNQSEPYYPGICSILSDIFPNYDCDDSRKPLANRYYDRIDPRRLCANVGEDTLKLMYLCCLYIGMTPSIVETAQGVIYMPREDEEFFKKYRQELCLYWRKRIKSKGGLNNLELKELYNSDPKQIILECTGVEDAVLAVIPITIAFRCDVVSAATENRFRKKEKELLSEFN